MKNTFLIIVLFLLYSSVLKCQDIHFSQPAINPGNPAFAGFSEYGSNLILAHRRQWIGIPNAQGFQTSQLSFDQQISVGKQDYFGWGCILRSDKAGQVGLGNMEALATAAYRKRISKSNYLNAGINLGFQQFRFNPGNTISSNEFNTSTGEVTLQQGENNLLYNTIISPELGAGILWQGSFGSSSTKSGYFMGSSLHHLIPSEKVFGGLGNPIPFRISFIGGLNIKAGYHNEIDPTMLFHRQGSLIDLNTGVSWRYFPRNNEPNLFFKIGGRTRFSNSTDRMKLDALIGEVGFHTTTGIGLGLSYDIHLLNTPTGANSLELFLSYNWNQKSFQKRNVFCPHF